MRRMKIDPQLQAEMDRQKFAARRVPIPDEELDLMRPYNITPPDPEKTKRIWQKVLRKMGWDDGEENPDRAPEVKGVKHGNE